MFLQIGLLSGSYRKLWLTGAALAVAMWVAGGPLMAQGVQVSAPAAVELLAPRPSRAPGPSRYPAEVLRVVDGDTFEARVQVWPGISITTLVRLRGIDTPEMRGRCPQERTKAEAARAALTHVLAEGGIEISSVTLDKYGGRVDAEAATGTTPDVSAALLRSGAARRYAGGRRDSWCS